MREDVLLKGRKSHADIHSNTYIDTHTHTHTHTYTNKQSVPPRQTGRNQLKPRFTIS